MALPVSDFKDYRETKQGFYYDDFGGLFSNIGRVGNNNTANTAALQTNLCCFAPGQIVSRPGLRVVQFDEDM